MRSVSIMVKCDGCQEPIVETEEGDSVVRFEARGTAFEMDLCNECLYGSFLQEARPSVNRKKRKKAKPEEEFECFFCKKTFATRRGLSAHQTRQAHD